MKSSSNTLNEWNVIDFFLSHLLGEISSKENPDQTFLLNLKMEDDNIFWHAMLRCNIQFMAAIFLTIFIIFFFPSSFRQESTNILM
jgi:hypothetical protein